MLVLDVSVESRVAEVGLAAAAIELPAIVIASRPAYSFLVPLLPDFFLLDSLLLLYSIVFAHLSNIPNI